MLRVGPTNPARASAIASRSCAATPCAPVADASIDAVTIAFGIRNVEQMDAACAEMHRVLKPGGRLAILEFAVPTTPGVSALYVWYLHRVLPLIGRAVSRHNAAYGYLPASIGAFASPDEFVKILRQAGFTQIVASPPDPRQRHCLYAARLEELLNGGWRPLGWLGALMIFLPARQTGPRDRD